MPDRHPLGRHCGVAVPLMLLLMPYALARHAYASRPRWMGRRG